MVEEGPACVPRLHDLVGTSGWPLRDGGGWSGWIPDVIHQGSKRSALFPLKTSALRNPRFDCTICAVGLVLDSNFYFLLF